MPADHDYEELHRLVDRLTPDQARALRAVALELVKSHPSDDEAGTASPSARRRRLPFARIMHAEPGLAERSEDILRTEFGHHTA
ncbi:hypothetical protein [Gandjariella thermophila]|uniref:Uncharacterized protein n=1 Tax=Gandjariella thermophila TaxID=1931992 RepID=A0A4D4JCC4_9PSEU|nr:hypothetical protein [Gandjariella thermophila]GDY32096.1 hypothetical protein GTS_37290 [Gandjariella thermophila]